MFENFSGIAHSVLISLGHLELHFWLCQSQTSKITAVYLVKGGIQWNRYNKLGTSWILDKTTTLFNGSKFCKLTFILTLKLLNWFFAGSFDFYKFGTSLEFRFLFLVLFIFYYFIYDCFLICSLTCSLRITLLYESLYVREKFKV